MKTSDLFSALEQPSEVVAFEPTRDAGLQRLAQFAKRAGSHYARQRNFDFGPTRRSNVSALSPWIRHRLVTEEDVLTQTLARHSPSSAEKFVQEVFWRTYFKGWLEQHPSVWQSYCEGVSRALDAGIDDCQAAMEGRTGIACFDHWAQELVATGYLHNHARMWFASIWIFTLRLPWQLGADFFLRHLLDGDPASNTLSWRWVGGLHTKGKTYLARADNIAKYTEDQFRPQGLATFAEPLKEMTDHMWVPLALPHRLPDTPYLLLLTEEDLSGADLIPSAPAGAIGLSATHGRSPNPLGASAQEFALGAMNNAVAPFAQHAESAEDWAIPLIKAAASAGVSTVATAYAPIGPVRSRLDRAEPALNKAGISVRRVVRPYDALAWPHAKAGFFGLRKKIPSILSQLNLAT